jgi:putative transposase
MFNGSIGNIEMQTSLYESLSHSKWGCKYHIVFIPKGRKEVLYGKIRAYREPLFHELASHRGSKIVKEHLVINHVYMMIKIPPKYAVAFVIGFIKGKSAIVIAREFGKRERNYRGEHFWTRGYAVS